MKLYHFCADHMLESILEQGLTLGSICWREAGSICRLAGWQWLTVNQQRDDQEWCNPEFSSLPYDRAANRITVVIPKSHRVHLYEWLRIGPLLMPRTEFDVLNYYGKPEDYRLFSGRIPPAWFRKTERLGARWGVIVEQKLSADPGICLGGEK